MLKYRDILKDVDAIERSLASIRHKCYDVTDELAEPTKFRISDKEKRNFLRKYDGLKIIGSLLVTIRGHKEPIMNRYIDIIKAEMRVDYEKMIVDCKNVEIIHPRCHFFESDYDNNCIIYHMEWDGTVDRLILRAEDSGEFIFFLDIDVAVYTDMTVCIHLYNGAFYFGDI